MIIVDPGQAGGIVTVGKAFTAIPMPKDAAAVVSAIKAASGIDFPPKICYLEELIKHVGKRPMPASRMATYASNWGMIKGAALALGFKLVIVHPKAWQKSLSLGGSKDHSSRDAWKRFLKNEAQKSFPHLNVTLSTADALLIYKAVAEGLLDDEGLMVAPQYRLCPKCKLQCSSRAGYCPGCKYIFGVN